MKTLHEPTKKNPLAPESQEQDSTGQTQMPPAFELQADSIAPPPGDSAAANPSDLPPSNRRMAMRLNHPLDSLGNAGRDSLPSFRPDTANQAIDSLGASIAPFKPKEETPKKKVAEKTTLFSQKIGKGQKNNPKDVYRLMFTLDTIGFATGTDFMEVAKDREKWEKEGKKGPFPDRAIAEIIKRYQTTIKARVVDGYISPGKATEKGLLNGKGGNKEEPKPKKKEKTEALAKVDGGPDYECIAQEIFEAGKGMGTDEEAIYKHLAMINPGSKEAQELKKVFAEQTGEDLEGYLKGELQDWFFGEESKALEMLNGKPEPEEEKDADSELQSDALIPIKALKGSVGKGGDNKAEDVKIIQDYLVALGYLSSGSKEMSKVRKLSSGEAVNKMPNTIKAIKNYQLYAMALDKAADGKVSAGHGTEKAMLGMVEMINEFSDYEIDNEPIGRILEEKNWINQWKSVPSRNGKGRGLKESERAKIGKTHNKCCAGACQIMMKEAGIEVVNGPSWNRIRTLLNYEGTDQTILNKQAEMASKYLDKELKAGRAVFAGVENGGGYYNDDKTTDHFVIIVGKVVDGDKVGFQFLDPGTRDGEKGASKENVLWLGKDFGMEGKSVYKKEGATPYKLSQIRRNKKR